MAARDRDTPGDREQEDAVANAVDRVLVIAETALYVVIALALLAGASFLLGDAIVHFFDGLGDSIEEAASELLGTLLLVFVFVELLGAVRTTVRERRLLAEPFLLVGIIASIKEIVVIAGAERPREEGFAVFRDAMVEVGVLAGVILILAISALLLRRREREPSESSSDE